MFTNTQTRLLCIFFAILCHTLFANLTISVDDTIELKASSDLGVPVHPASGDRVVSERLADGSTAKIKAIDGNNHWVQIQAGQTCGWIIQKYIKRVINGSPEEPSAYVVGCWNLEHFHDGAKRGFPENTKGGPGYPTRSLSDYDYIASIIRSLEYRILVLEEIYAYEDTDSDHRRMRSKEVETLIEHLGGDNYAYEVSRSGGSQHIAILYDKRYVRLNSVCECDFEDEKMQRKSLFDRQPLFAHFTFLKDGQSKNDLLVMGVHLASGQHLTRNHDKAMELIIDKIKIEREGGECIPSDENDILIAGDFNANRFDSKLEMFWDRLESSGWDVMADTILYPVTRLSGHPLGLNNSRIDYIIITSGDQGLFGEEVIVETATVHTELIGDDAESFRKQASDHLPVSVEILVMEDSDTE